MESDLLNRIDLVEASCMQVGEVIQTETSIGLYASAEV